MTTTHVRAQDTEERWLLYDAREFKLGHMAAAIARNLMGKDRPTYTPSELGGAHVVVTHCTEAQLSGTKSESKTYSHYTGYIRGLREVTIEEVKERRPEDIVTLAVRRMLPKTRLGHRMLARLKVYPGDDHPHAAQQPVKVSEL